MLFRYSDWTPEQDLGVVLPLKKLSACARASGVKKKTKNPTSIWLWLVSVTYWQEFLFSMSLMVLQMQTAASHPTSCTLVSAALGRNTAPNKKDIPVPKSMCETGKDSMLWVKPNTCFLKNHDYKNLTVTDLFQPSYAFKRKSLGVCGEKHCPPPLSTFIFQQTKRLHW